MLTNCPKLTKSDVNVMVYWQAFEAFEHKASGAEVTNNFGMKNVPTARVESASSSGGLALRLGVLAVLSGVDDVVVVVELEKMSSKETSEAIRNNLHGFRQALRSNGPARLWRH